MRVIRIIARLESIRYNPAELLKELGMTNETMVEEIRNKMA